MNQQTWSAPRVAHLDLQRGAGTKVTIRSGP
jgi:hypothetical protein